MSRALVVIHSSADRERVARWAMNVPYGTRIEFKNGRRTLDQNSKFWAMLGDISTQVKWHGIKLKSADWRLIFLDALKRELRVVPNLDGTGFVNLGRSSSDLSKEEMSDLISLMEAWGAENGVVFHDPQQMQAAE